MNASATAAAPARKPVTRLPEDVSPARRRRIVGRIIFAMLAAAAAISGALAGLLVVYSVDLPQISDLEHYRPSTVTQLYDDGGREVGSFALERRVIVSYDDLGPVLRAAIVSIEDKEFEGHAGVNFWRMFGAAYQDVLRGKPAQGGSTLTMQLSRNLFLTPDRNFRRKVQEIMLAIQIERRFTKQQIFTLYCNQIYLGHGVYGFEAGAEYYFGKHARELTLAEASLLAGLPKAPNYYSPLNHPDRALRRRNLVINNLLEDGKITAMEATRAKATALLLNLRPGSETLAPYFVEEIRQYLEQRYGSSEVHEGGLRVYTTLNVALQQAANQAVLDGLAEYEHRHGWKGHLHDVLRAGEAPGGDLGEYTNPEWDAAIGPGSYVHALVESASANSAELRLGRFHATLTPADARWTGRAALTELIKPGDLAYVKVVTLGAKERAHVTLEQESGVQGALVALDNTTGDVMAMVGGRDFRETKFNRATQALRQVGSSFKPYVYTAAIDQGATPDDVVLDAPVVFPTASGPYAPHNYDGKFEGRITLRRALAQSRNIPALRVAESVSIHTVIDYVHRFGVTSNIPPYLPIALGSAEITLLEQTAAYSVFPNDGVRVAPRYIRQVTDRDGHVLEQNYSEVREVVSAATARTMTAMLREVVQHGTAQKAASLGYSLAGKTGTTNDFTDAWFLGFSPSVTCGVWIGFDEKKSLGEKETGAQAALPVWMSFMGTALKGRENESFFAPPALHANNMKVDTLDHAAGDGETH